MIERDNPVQRTRRERNQHPLITTSRIRCGVLIEDICSNSIMYHEIRHGVGPLSILTFITRSLNRYRNWVTLTCACESYDAIDFFHEMNAQRRNCIGEKKVRDLRDIFHTIKHNK